MIKGFFELLNLVPPPVAIGIVILVSGWFVYKGLMGLKKNEIGVSYFSKIFNAQVSYKGKESIAPSIFFIFLGCLFPLIFLSLLIDYLFNIVGSMFTILPIFVFIFLFLLIDIRMKFRK